MLATSSVELTNRVELVTTLPLGTPLSAHGARDPTSKPEPKTCTSSVESTVAVSGLVDLTVGPLVLLAADAFCVDSGAEGGAVSVQAKTARSPRINRGHCENERESGRRLMTHLLMAPG